MTEPIIPRRTNAQKVERQLATAASIAGSLLSLYIVARLAFGPDAIVRFRMRAYRTISVSAKHGADALLVLASTADTAYHRSRNTTV